LLKLGKRTRTSWDRAHDADLVRGGLAKTDDHGRARVMPMKWTSKFPRPIVLKDGRKNSSLIQARDVIAPDWLLQGSWKEPTSKGLS
jgi:hypothetical protein